MHSDRPELVTVSVGNTRTAVGVFRGPELYHSAAVLNSDLDAATEAITSAPVSNPNAPVVVASVNDPIAGPLLDRAAEAVSRRGGDIYRFGKDLAIPIQNSLVDDTTVGQDRLLNALGAFSRAKQACIVIDAGTAITVDFVDGQGVFQGGAIAPGLHLMLRSLHEHTAALPSITFERPNDADVFGKDTAGAMRLGVRAAAVGLVRFLAERYAEFYGAYPQIIATGGDARVLFEGDDLVEQIVPNLTLFGIEAACRIQLGLDDSDEDL
ncbi:MAG: type III pantothenate kinase [Phycisphaeraceae bacterium]|nr:type III pantothenate kinase [Phycisphaeraceae bacterium]